MGVHLVANDGMISMVDRTKASELIGGGVVKFELYGGQNDAQPSRNEKNGC